MAWDVEGLVASLAGRSEHTRRAYEHDAREFAAWAERGGCPDPGHVDRKTLRRYLAYLETRGLARRSVGRKAAAVRALLTHLRRAGVVPADPGRALRTPRGDTRLPRVPSAPEAAALLDTAADAASATGVAITGAIIFAMRNLCEGTMPPVCRCFTRPAQKKCRYVAAVLDIAIISLAECFKCLI